MSGATPEQRGKVVASKALAAGAGREGRWRAGREGRGGEEGGAREQCPELASRAGAGAWWSEALASRVGAGVDHGDRGAVCNCRACAGESEIGRGGPEGRAHE